MLALENLTIGYDDKRVIESLNTTIQKDKITVIIGPNGCGKSTLLKAVTRVIKPNNGQVILDGKDVHKMPTKVIARQMSFLPQSHDKVTGLTVYELVSYGRYPYQKGLGKLSKTDYEKIDWALAATGITSIKHNMMDALSGGQKQRAWIAMALVQDTEMIFLDEPTTYLDISHQLEILHLLKTLNEKNNRTIVMVLHDINQAARYADYVIAIKDGVIRYNANAYDVIKKDVIRDVFEVDVDIMHDPETNRPIVYNYKKVEKKGLL
ncbi:MAG: ABC transporter ATP-binding protein [Bacillota bacterium]